MNFMMTMLKRYDVILPNSSLPYADLPQSIRHMNQFAIRHVCARSRQNDDDNNDDDDNGDNDDDFNAYLT